MSEDRRELLSAASSVAHASARASDRQREPLLSALQRVMTGLRLDRNPRCRCPRTGSLERLDIPMHHLATCLEVIYSKELACDCCFAHFRENTEYPARIDVYFFASPVVVQNVGATGGHA